MNSIDNQSALKRFAYLFGIDLTKEPQKKTYVHDPAWQYPMSIYADPARFPVPVEDADPDYTHAREMKLSAMGIALIQHFEDLRLKAYKDATGTPTIGWGTTVYPDGTPVRIGDVITQDEAALIFKEQIPEYGKIVSRFLLRKVYQHEFDAAVSFAYNAGAGYYTNGRFKPFNLWRHINDKADEASMSNYWQNLAITSKGKKLNGLVRRRKAEVFMYLHGQLNFFE